MKRFFLLSYLLFASSLLLAEDADTYVKAGLAADEHYDSRKALASFRKADELRPNDAFVLQKISKELSDLTAETTDVETKKRLVAESMSFAERAVQIEPHNAVNVLSLAVLHGKMAAWADTRQKVAYSRLIKEEAERALALDANYDWAHHVLARWNYEVASLSSTSRFFVKLIYGGLPEASYEQAAMHMERAIELSHTTVAHQLELGFVYLAWGKKNEAKAQFQRGLAMPSREKYDDEAKSRARKALEGLS
jgi:tetratricopeptide (TPR) repeat protein